MIWCFEKKVWRSLNMFLVHSDVAKVSVSFGQWRESSSRSTFITPSSRCSVVLGSRNTNYSNIYGIYLVDLHFRTRWSNLKRPNFKFCEILELKTDSEIKINITYHMSETLGTDSGKIIPQLSRGRFWYEHPNHKVWVEIMNLIIIRVIYIIFNNLLWSQGLTQGFTPDDSTLTFWCSYRNWFFVISIFSSSRNTRNVRTYAIVIVCNYFLIFRSSLVIVVCGFTTSIWSRRPRLILVHYFPILKIKIFQFFSRHLFSSIFMPRNWITEKLCSPQLSWLERVLTDARD